MLQPHLIDQLVEDTKILSKAFKPPTTPAKSSRILQRHEHSKPFNQRWHYRSVIGKLNYLEKMSRPDISYATHQCARFSEDPKEKHVAAVEHLVQYFCTELKIKE